MMRTIFSLFAICALFLASAVYAGTVSGIQVNGNQRVEASTVLSFLQIDKGANVSDADIDAAVDRIFESGLFADVNIELRGGTLVVNVSENPVISQVAFEGNKRLDDDTLRKEVSLTERAVFNKSDLQQDVRRLLDVYRKNGRYSVQIVPKVIEKDQNRVDLVYEIDEGEKSKIARISFVGNHVFNDDVLQSVIQTKESRWYRFLSSDDLFDADRLDYDKELLRKHYVSNGYADFRVVSATAELSPDRENFFVTYTLEEGPKYNFGKVDIESEIKEVTPDQLTDLLRTAEGDVFNADQVDKTVDELTNKMGNLGYAFVKIEPQYQRNAEDKLMGVHYLVKEGPRVYVENINVRGNVRTMDEVIRREFRLAEGDPYNADKLKRSQQRIRNLGFFENVDFKNEQGSEDDRVNVNVDVQEKSTGELTFGAGFSTADGALGDIGISERNLLGKGQYLKLNFTLASVRQEIDLSFTEPYLFGRELAGGFDLFSTKLDSRSSRNNRTYDSESIGGVLRGSYPLSEHLSHQLRYTARQDNITNIQSAASQFIKRQEGENTTSAVGHSLVWDNRDNNFFPTEGYTIRFNQDVAGAGGDAQYIRNELRSAYYHPVIGDDWVLKLAAKAGHVMGYGGEDVRINDRFFIGGEDLRGFANQGIGPRDSVSKDPLGGNIYAAGTVEVNFPVGLPKELGVNGSVFTDFGTLYNNDDGTVVNPDGSVSHVLDENSIRAAAGFGVSWRSPFGPIRIDIAEPYMDEAFDDTEQLRFSFGTRF